MKPWTKKQKSKVATEYLGIGVSTYYKWAGSIPVIPIIGLLESIDFEELESRDIKKIKQKSPLEIEWDSERGLEIMADLFGVNTRTIKTWQGVDRQDKEEGKKRGPDKQGLDFIKKRFHCADALAHLTTLPPDHRRKSNAINIALEFSKKIETRIVERFVEILSDQYLDLHTDLCKIAADTISNAAEGGLLDSLSMDSFTNQVNHHVDTIFEEYDGFDPDFYAIHVDEYTKKKKRYFDNAVKQLRRLIEPTDKSEHLYFRLNHDYIKEQILLALHTEYYWNYRPSEEEELYYQELQDAEMHIVPCRDKINQLMSENDMVPSPEELHDIFLECTSDEEEIKYLILEYLPSWDGEFSTCGLPNTFSRMKIITEEDEE